MAEPVRLGIVGLGRWGRILGEAVQRSDHGEIVACFARTDEQRDQFASDFSCRSSTSLESMLEDDGIEGVIYATPHSQHRAHVELAAAAGVHAFVEKPFTLNAEDGAAAIAAANSAGIQLMVGQQRRRLAANRRLRKMIDSGEIGTPLHGEASFFVSRGYPNTWRAMRDETPLGGMTALGVHCLDTFHYLLGDVSRVSAFSNPLLADAPLDHATGLLLEFTSGAVATVLTSHYAPAANRTAIYGSEGAGFNEDDGKRFYTQAKADPVRHEVTLEHVDPIVEQVDEFAQAIRGESEIETGGAEGLAVVKVLQAAVASATSGQTVNISDF